jgi:hypothetical protein
LEKSFKELRRNLQTFWTLLSNLRTKFKRTYEGSFEELGKSFKELGKSLAKASKESSKFLAKFFQVLGRKFRNTSEKISNFYSNDSNKQFFFEDAKFPGSPFEPFSKFFEASFICSFEFCS